MPQRDFDKFDDYCDHLLVDRSNPKKKPGEEGSCRHVPICCVEALHCLHEGFYSADEFDLNPVYENYPGEIVELGRSCVDPDLPGQSRHAIVVARNCRIYHRI